MKQTSLSQGREDLVLTDSASRDAVASDFGGMTTQAPVAFARPSSVLDVVQTLDWASKRNIRVVARGRGHSTRGQASVRDGVVIDLGRLNHINVVGTTACVGAGASWESVLDVTLSRGLTPPTLTDYLRLSVGGTLAVGGVGGQSFRYGLQTDSVLELTVVTGTGAIVRCSPQSDALLFDACRAGLGQCGIVVEAKLELVKAPSEVRVVRMRYGNVRVWLEDQLRFAREGCFDYLLGSVAPSERGWSYFIEAASYGYDGAPPAAVDRATLRCDSAWDMPEDRHAFADYANRLDAMERTMKATGAWRACHPWLDLFLPADTCAEVIERALSSFDPTQLADSHTLTYPVCAGACKTPLAAVPPGDAFLFGVGPNLDKRDRIGLTKFENTCGEIVAQALALGGGIYPIGYPVNTSVMRANEWQAHFARGWETLRCAKRRYDPNHLFAGPAALEEAFGL